MLKILNFTFRHVKLCYVFRKLHIYMYVSHAEKMVLHVLHMESKQKMMHMYKLCNSWYCLEFFFADDLGISYHQQNNLRILVHVLYNNPRVLYAPNNSAADTIIRKVKRNLDLYLLDNFFPINEMELYFTDDTPWHKEDPY